MPDRFKKGALYHAAIIQSGGFASWASQPLHVSQHQYENLMEALECQDLDCLLKTPATLLQSTFDSTNHWKNPLCAYACQIAPTVDYVLLNKDLAKLSEKARTIPTLQGWVKNDAADYVSMDKTLTYGTYTMNQTTYQ